jgi:hypothetical protein
MIGPLVQLPADAFIGRYCRVSAAAAPQQPGNIDTSADGLDLFASQFARKDTSDGGRVSK